MIDRNRHRVLLATTAAAALLIGAVSAHATPLPRPRPANAPAITINSLLAPTPLAQQTQKQLTQKPTPLADAAPLPRKRPASGAAATEAFAQANVGLRGSLFTASATFKPLARPVSGPFAVAPTTSTSAADIAAVKNVIEATRKGKEADAEAAKRGITDPVARKLAEWVILRSDNTKPTFFRYAAFINENPAWPHVPMFRRRAENALWNDKLDDNSVRTFFAQRQPTTAKGRLIWARALLAKGDRAGAETFAKYAWREDEMSADVERQALEMFGALITPADTRLSHAAALLSRRHDLRASRGPTAWQRRRPHREGVGGGDR